MSALVLLLACRGAQPPALPGPAVDRVELIAPSAERDALTLAYARVHTGADQGLEIVPRMVVLHGTMDSDLAVHRARLEPASLPDGREDLSWAGRMNVAVHFVVDRDGTVVQVLPETRYGRHTVGFNHVAIGVEHLGDGPEHRLTEAQVSASAALVRELAGRHPVRHLAGHHQLVNSPEDHPLFSEQVDDYRTFARDPGDAFVAAVARALGDLEITVP